ncbi:MAG: amidohydrolase [Haloferacaceae archaeon]
MDVPTVIDSDALVALRRDLHRHPEPGWCEFYTTARLVAALERRPLDAIYVGPEVLADDRIGVPDAAEREQWRERALAAGARGDLIDDLDGGRTGLMAVLERGDGPTVALRVDIDALPITESDDDDHYPARTGFRSENEGYMHACGHDAHATIGVGVLDAIVESDFAGTLKVLFQPAEEIVAGADPIARSGHLDDVDHLLAVHVGLDHPTGEVVAGIGGFLAVAGFRAEFRGASAHAGGHPSQGRHAVRAAATAVTELHAIPRHEDGATRVNAGRIEGGTASNVVPERASVEGEVRGGTTALMEYMEERADRVLRAAAEMHGCEVDVERRARAPSAESDDDLADLVAEAAREVGSVTTLLERDDLGGSEDATYLMRRVQARGGTACYVGVGTDHPGGHHTPTFDVDEETIPTAVEVLTRAILALSRREGVGDA